MILEEFHPKIENPICLICENKLKVDHGIFVLDAGTIDINFFFGSKFDQTQESINIKSYICDTCYEKKKNIIQHKPKIYYSMFLRYIIQKNKIKEEDAVKGYMDYIAEQNEIIERYKDKV